MGRPKVIGVGIKDAGNHDDKRDDKNHEADDVHTQPPFPQIRVILIVADKATRLFAVFDMFLSFLGQPVFEFLHTSSTRCYSAGGGR